MGSLYIVIVATRAFNYPVLSIHIWLLTGKQLFQMKSKICGGLNETERTLFYDFQLDILAWGRKEKGVSVKRAWDLAFKLEHNAVNEVGSWRRVMGYEVLGFCLRKSALVDKLRGMPIPPG